MKNNLIFVYNMTTEEKDRLEIVKEVCGLQDCTPQEIYNFVKAAPRAECARFRHLISTIKL